jgi:hypothetical protein
MELLEQGHTLTMMRTTRRLANSNQELQNEIKSLNGNEEKMIQKLDSLLAMKIKYFKPDYDITRP